MAALLIRIRNPILLPLLRHHLFHTLPLLLFLFHFSLHPSLLLLVLGYSVAIHAAVHVGFRFRSVEVHFSAAFKEGIGVVLYLKLIAIIIIIPEVMCFAETGYV